MVRLDDPWFDGLDTEEWVDGESHDIVAVLDRVQDMSLGGERPEDILEFFRREAVLGLRVELSTEQAASMLTALLIEQGSVSGAEDSQQLLEPAPSLMQRLGFLRGAISIGIKTRLMRSCPKLMGLIHRDYLPLSDDEEPLSLVDVFSYFGNNIDGLASIVVRSVEYIRHERAYDPGFLMPNEDMEFLRKVVYLLDSLKLSDSMFCEFGQKLIVDMRVFVGQYEEAMASR